ncbi:MAG: DivIVA domain-containing protein [Oscillospiraceae bacterium]|nr:DivIVA domain-containing protein [Oscillospiraceae bacterium]
MLTPVQIKTYRFQSAGRGLYRSDEVDNFFEKVSESYELIFKENAELIKRVNLLAEKIEEYRKDEELIKKTLLIAQRKADDMERDAAETGRERLASAEKEAAEKLRDAEEAAGHMVAAANGKAERALKDAKKISESSIQVAEEKAARLVADAQRKVDAALGRLQDDVARETQALEQVRAESKKFKETITGSYHKQLSIVSRLLDFVEIDEAAVAEAMRFAEPKPVPQSAGDVLAALAAQGMKAEAAPVTEDPKPEVPASKAADVAVNAAEGPVKVFAEEKPELDVPVQASLPETEKSAESGIFNYNNYNPRTARVIASLELEEERSGLSEDTYGRPRRSVENLKNKYAVIDETELRAGEEQTEVTLPTENKSPAEVNLPPEFKLPTEVNPAPEVQPQPEISGADSYDDSDDDDFDDDVDEDDDDLGFKIQIDDIEKEFGGEAAKDDLAEKDSDDKKNKASTVEGRLRRSLFGNRSRDDDDEDEDEDDEDEDEDDEDEDDEDGDSSRRFKGFFRK